MSSADPDETIAVVDSENAFVRWAPRADVHTERLFHRSVQVIVRDAAGRVLVQRRHPDKRTWPNAWDVSVAGHVDAQDYDQPIADARGDAVARAAAAAARRELAEELGVDAPVTRIGHWSPADRPGSYEHATLFLAHWSGPVTPAVAEIAEVRWVDHHQWSRLADTDRVTDQARALLAWAAADGWWPADTGDRAR